VFTGGLSLIEFNLLSLIFLLSKELLYFTSLIAMLKIVAYSFQCHQSHWQSKLIASDYKIVDNKGSSGRLE
jgi:hypothetical protein